MSGFDFQFDITQDVTIPDEKPKEDITWERWLDNVATGIKRQNYLAGAVNKWVNDIEDPTFGYDPNYFFDQDDANKGYDPFIMSRARSAEEAAFMRSRIDVEMSQLEQIRNESGGAIGEIFGAVFQPHVLVGGWGSLGWRGIAAMEGGLEVGSEMLLHEEQLTRTKTESLINAAAVTSGALVLGGISKGFEIGMDKAYSWKADKGAIDDLGPGADSAGSARVGISKEDAALSAVGAGANRNSVFGRAVARILAWGPRARLSRSESTVARTINEELTDPSFYTKGMEEGSTAGITVESEVFKRQGDFVAVMDEVQAIQQTTTMKYDDFDKELGKALSSGDRSKFPEVEKAAKMVRERILEPMRQEMIELGINIGKTQFAKSYFPRIYDQGAILNNMDRVKRMLTKHYTKAAKEARATRKSVTGDTSKRKMTVKERQADAAKRVREQERIKAEIKAEVDRDVMQTIHNMLGGIPVDQGVLSGANSALKKRTLSLTDSVLAPYLDKRASTVLTRYTAGMNPYLIMKARYGDEMLTEKIKMVTREYERLISQAADAKDTKRVAQLEKQLGNDIRDLQHVRDRLLHRVQRSTDPGSRSEKIVQFTKNFNIATQLLGITLSSAPDIVRPMATAGLRSYSKGLARGLTGFAKSMAGKPDAQVRRMGIAVQRTMNDRMSQMAEIGEAQSNLNAQMQKWWGRLTLFNHWTDAMEGVAAHTMMDFTLRLAKKAAAGKELTKTETMKMARMGFDLEDLRQFHAAAKKTGGADDPDLLYADTLEWADIELAKKFEAGIGSQVRRDIVRIGAGEKPLGMDNNLQSLIFQYQSFAIAATNRMLVSNLQQMDRQMLEGVLAGVFLGGLVGMSKAQLRGDDPTKWTEGKFLREGIDRSGMLGVYNAGFNFIRNVAGDAPSRYAHRGLSSILGGSTIGQVERAAQIAGHVMEGEMVDAAKDASYLVPGLNLLHFRDLMMRLAEDN